MSKPATQTSLKKNFIYNTIPVLLNFLMPLITFPYVTRVLGPENLGKVNFVLAFVLNFAVFVSIINPLYAVREVAKNRDDKEKTSKLFSEMIVVNFLMGLAVFAVYMTLWLFLGKMRAEPVLFFIGGINILLSGIFIDWLFQGMEDFRYISIRNIGIRIVFIILVFIFVRDSKDYVWYLFLNILSQSGINLFNLLFCRKYVKFSLKDLDWKRHFRNVTIFYAINLFSTFTGNIDKLFMGFLYGDETVGFNAIADRFVLMAVAFISSMSSVLLPRISYYREKKMTAELYGGLNKALKAVLMMTLPMVAGTLLLAPEIVALFGGENYGLSVVFLRIQSAKIFIVGLAYIFGLQLLVSSGRESKYFLSLVLSVGAFLALLYPAVKLFSYFGIAVVGTFSYFVQVLVQAISAREELKRFAWKTDNLLYFASTLVMTAAVYFLKRFVPEGWNVILKVLIFVAGGAGLYFLILFIFREPILGEILAKLKSRLMPAKGEGK